MAQNQVFEGRADLHIQPFLDSLDSLEQQAEAATTEIAAAFQKMDTAIDAAVSSIRTSIATISAQLSTVSRAIGNANGAEQRAKSQVANLKQQAAAADALTQQNIQKTKRQTELERQILREAGKELTTERAAYIASLLQLAEEEEQAQRRLAEQTQTTKSKAGAEFQRAQAEVDKQLLAQSTKAITTRQQLELRTQLRQADEEFKRLTQERMALRTLELRDLQTKKKEELEASLQSLRAQEAAIIDHKKRVDDLNLQTQSKLLAGRKADSEDTTGRQAFTPSQYRTLEAEMRQYYAQSNALERQLTATRRANTQIEGVLFETSAQKMSKAMLQIAASTGDFGTRLQAALEQAKRRLTEVEDGLNSIYRAGAQLMQFGGELSFMGVVLGYLGKNLIDNTGDFDFWLTRVTAAAEAAQIRTGEELDKTLVNVEEFKQGVYEIGRDVGVLDPAEIAKGWYLYQSALGSAIETTDDMRGHTENLNQALRASVVTDTDVSVVLRGTTQAMAEFGLGASDLETTLATMVNVTQVTQAEFSDMLEAFKQAGPQAHRLGIPLSDVAALFGLLAEQGIRGSQAGRLFSSGMVNLISPTKQQAKALQNLFVVQRDLVGGWEQFLFKGGEFVGLYDTLNEKGETVTRGALAQFHEATKQLTAAKREGFLADIFGKDAGKVWSTAIGQYSNAQKEAEAINARAKTSFDTAAQAMQNPQLLGNTSLFTRMSEQMNSTSKNVEAFSDVSVNKFEAMAIAMRDPEKQLSLFGDQWEAVSESVKVRTGQVTFSFEELRQQLGLILADNLIPILQHIDGIIRAFLKWGEQDPVAVNNLITLLIKLTAALLIVGPLLYTFGFAIQSFAAIPTAFAALTTAFGALRTISVAALVPLQAVGASILALGAPMWLIIAAVVALGIAWATNMFGLRDATAGLVSVIGQEFQAIGDLVGNLFKVVAGLVLGSQQLIDDGLTGMATAAIEALYVLPKNALLAIAQMGVNIAAGLAVVAEDAYVWGHNIVVSLINGLLSVIGQLAAVSNTLAEMIARNFRSFSPPRYGPLKDIQKWGRNLSLSLIEGMNSVDFDAVFTFSDQIAEAVKRNIDDGFVSASSFSDAAGQAGVLISEMLGIVKGGGLVNETFFASLTDGLGEWYGYLVDIALAYQDVYANERQLSIEKEKLDVIKSQRDELSKQDKARKAAFEKYAKGTRATTFDQNAANIVDPLTDAGRAKIDQMRRELSTEEFQNWLRWQQEMWNDRVEAEDQSLQQQEQAQQTIVSTIDAQLAAAKTQHELAQKVYEYAVRQYKLTEEQKRLEEEIAKKKLAAAGGASTIGSPEQLNAFLAEITNAIGRDTAILDETSLRDRAGGDDIRTVGDAGRQAIREQERVAELDKLNRRKRAEFEVALINATTEEERATIKQQQDAWDAAYRQEKSRLTERLSLSRDIVEASEAMADATLSGRIGATEVQFYEQIKKLLGDQTSAIADANTLKSISSDLDAAQLRAKEQQRTEERLLRDLQALGDQKKLEFEQRLRDAKNDPEATRRIKEEQQAWDTAYKTALEAQQLRVENSRRAQQDLADQAAAMRELSKIPIGGGAGGGFELPDYGAGAPAFERPAWLNEDGTVNWKSLNGRTAPEKLEIKRDSTKEAEEIFANARRGLQFLLDDSISAGDKWKLVGQTFTSYTDNVEAQNAAVNANVAASLAAFGASTTQIWNTLVANITATWQTFSASFSEGWNAFWTVTVPTLWSVFSTSFSEGWNAFWAGVATMWTTFSTSFSESWNTFWGTITTWFDQNVSTPFKNKWAELWQTVTTLWETTKTTIETGWAAFWATLDTAWTNFKTTFVTTWNTVWGGLLDKWEAFWATFKPSFDKMVDGLSSLLDPVRDFINQLGSIQFPSLPDWFTSKPPTPSGGGGGGGGYAQGLFTVPYDNFNAVLHAGERILTAKEAAFYNSLETSMSAMASALSRVGATTMGGSKTIIINVGSIEASNPDEGRAFLSKLAFLT